MIKRVWIAACLVLLFTVYGLAQNTVKEVIYSNADPVGTACVDGKIYVNRLTGVNTERINGVCTPVTAGGTPGTVTSVSVTTANGVSGSVATATTTPAITLTLGAITPSSIGAFTLAGTVAGGGNQLNNVIIGTSNPLAGLFTTLSGATSVTTPKIVDTNGNELVIFTTTASAVNEWTLADGATGVNPKLTASGETNVGLDFQVKGTGVYRLLSTASGPTDLRLFEDTDNGSNYASIIAPATLAGDVVLTLPSATATFGTLAGTETLTNKTMAYGSNTFTGFPFNLGSQADGVPGSSAVVLRFAAATAFTLSASGHQCSAGTAATAQTDFAIAANGVAKGTLRFAASGTTCSIVSGASASVAAGQVVTITAPGSADATLANIAFTLLGTLP